MTLKVPFLTVWLGAVTLIMVGCSSSEQPATLGSTDLSSTKPVSSEPQVNAILQHSCFQCHSTGGAAPWYAAVSPTYLAANSAREVLNFSDWQTYDAAKKAQELKNIEQSVGADSMPPGDFTALDHSARLTDDQKREVLKWAALPVMPAH
jgi:hypothetical protein